jgi:hypothetical protein
VTRVPPKGRRRADTRQPPRDRSALEFGRERFRFTLLRGQRRLPALNIDPYVETADWQRDDAVRTGELNFRQPLTGRQAGAIAAEDQVLCEVDLHGFGRWQRCWQMTVATPSNELSSGVIAVSLKAGLKALQQSKAAFRYRNMTARQITLAVARRFHVKVGTLPAARHRIDRITRHSASPIDVITAAWTRERRATGRRFDVSVSRGVIDVIELREPARTLVIDKAVIDATLQETLDLMASAVVVTSTRTVGGRKHKIRVRVVDRARVRRYGYIVRNVNRSGLHSEAAAREFGRQELARRHKPVSDITFTHPGLPFVDRGAVIRLRLPPVAFDQLCFVKSTSHSVSAGSYEMEVTVGFADPWAADERKKRAAAKRAAAARRRKRRGHSSRTPAPAARKTARRSGA